MEEKRLEICKRKLSRKGKSTYAFTIPKPYIDNGQIDLEKEYDIIIIENNHTKA